MKIAVTSKGQGLDDAVDPRFGRCPFFVVVDGETMECEALENRNAAAGGGAGIQSAQLMADNDVEVVLTGNCGPNAYRTLEAADIRVVVDVSGTVREAVEQFKAETPTHSSGPNVQSHFGTRHSAC
ncbi:MAG: NifB/NifX family molybdenum-iron cluster-binding protein [Verrucomicrobiota bacterium]